MTFILPDAKSIRLDSKLTIPGASLNAGQLLALGAVLQVTILRDREGRIGILHDGQFLPAKVPDGTKNGEQVTVKVVDTTEATVLKIVQQQSEAGTECGFLPTLKTLLEHLLPNKDLRDLKQSRSSTSAQQLTPNDDKADPLQHQTDQLLLQLSQQGILPSAQDLMNSNRLRAVLLHLDDGSMLSKIQEAKEALGRLKAQAATLNSPATNSLATSSLATLRNAQGLLGAQEILHKLTPLLNCMGEPALLLVPCLLEGLLTRWELAIDPDESSTSETLPFHHLRLFLPFPHLGPLQAEIAYRGTELYLKLIVKEERAAQSISAEIIFLEKNLKEIGFHSPHISLTTGEPAMVAPQWYRDMTREEVVA